MSTDPSYTSLADARALPALKSEKDLPLGDFQEKGGRAYIATDDTNFEISFGEGPKHSARSSMVQVPAMREVVVSLGSKKSNMINTANFLSGLEWDKLTIHSGDRAPSGVNLDFLRYMDFGCADMSGKEITLVCSAPGRLWMWDELNAYTYPSVPGCKPWHMDRPPSINVHIQPNALIATADEEVKPVQDPLVKSIAETLDRLRRGTWGAPINIIMPESACYTFWGQGCEVSRDEVKTALETMLNKYGQDVRQRLIDGTLRAEDISQTASSSKSSIRSVFDPVPPYGAWHVRSDIKDPQTVLSSNWTFSDGVTKQLSEKQG